MSNWGTEIPAATEDNPDPLSEETLRRLQQWSEKLGKPVEELRSMVNANIATLLQHHPNLPQKAIEARARSMVYTSLKRQLQSPAVPFEGVFLGLADPFNVVAAMRRTSEEMWKKDPQTAVDGGYTDKEGVPLYRKGYNKGSPLPAESWIRNGMGVGKPVKGESVQPFSITLSSARARTRVPQGLALQFRVNIKGTEEAYTLNDSTTTEFKETTIPGLPSPTELLDSVCAHMKVNLDGLEEWHAKNQGKYTTVLVAEGDVVSIDLDVSDRSHRIVIDDETLGFEDAEGNLQWGVTCWVPKTIPLDFGPGSRILVVGQTAPTQGWDPETNEPDPNIVRMTINAWGVWPRPEFLIPRAEIVIPAEEVNV